MIPFMGETVCRAFNFVFIPVFLLLLYIYIHTKVSAFNLGKITVLDDQNKGKIYLFR